MSCRGFPCLSTYWNNMSVLPTLSMARFEIKLFLGSMKVSHLMQRLSSIMLEEHHMT